ncbi:unnamed protein product [Candida verbasci]|uniref:PNPLA domain-containing protein n=1 Tax=Candida verbasci TaxID=1227364 RepID=A0A9W4TXP5_9ASCO|nr:unnamed protein product [Candida verbasci]
MSTPDLVLNLLPTNNNNNNTIQSLNTTLSSDDIIQQLFNQYIGLKPLKNEYVLQEQDENQQHPRFSLRSLPLIGRLLPDIDEKTKQINKLLQLQKSTTTYKEWYEISLKLDEVMGNNAWKSDPKSDLYDYNQIYKNLNQMKQARLNNDYKLLLYHIRTKWIRNLGNMGDSNLYRHSYVGTKKLIEEYNEECKLSLDYLISSENVNLDDRYLLGMLIQTRKNIGRTALVLSGGSTFGIFHIGVLATLFEINLLPRIISGSSAGSIMAGILCCHTNEETFELLQTIASRKFNIFEITECDLSDIQSNFRKILYFLGHLIKYGTIFDIEGLQDTMIDFLGDLTFREAYNRTGKILNITVSPASIHEQTRLLNYLTAPNCLIWSAVCASCSLPGVFPSSSVYEKNPKTNEIHEWNNDESMKYMDGSVDNDLPITRLSEMFNVDHIIAVQVNPHVVPILKISISNIGGEIENDLSYKMKHLLNNVYDFFSCEAIHYLQLLNELDIYKNLSNKVISILSQNYSGDITILPEYKVSDFIKLFHNPNPEFLLDFICRGAKASWPKVSIIHNHCSVEFALDRAITILKGKIITSEKNRITSGVKRSQSYNPKSKNQQNITLVTSPDDQHHNQKIKNKSDKQQISEPNTPIKQRPFGIQRHHSTSNTTAATKANIPSRSKRNSMSAAEGNNSDSESSNGTSKKLSKRVSTTVLTHGWNRKVTTTDSVDSDNTITNEENNNTNGHQYQSTQKIRKARSSGNFRHSTDFINGGVVPQNTNTKLKFNPDRIPLKNNPYLEDNIQSILPKTDIDFVDSKENNPNLPTRSNSHRNSYIGLNRLKDNNLSRSNNNSTLHLKSSHLNGGELFKKLEKENEKRKSILKNGNNDMNDVGLDLFTNSDEDDLCKFELSNENDDASYDDGESESNENDSDEFDDANDPNEDDEEEDDDEIKKYDVDDEIKPEKEGSVPMDRVTDSVVDEIEPFIGNK